MVWIEQGLGLQVKPLLSLGSGGWEARTSSLPPRRSRHFVMRDAPHITKWRALDSQSPIWCRPGMEITASSFKLRANAPEGRKAISYQILNLHAEVRRLNAFAVHGLEPTANPVVRAILANPARSFVCHLLATFSVAVGTGLCRNVRVVVRLRFQCWWGFKYVCPAHIGTLRYNVDLHNTQHSDLCVMVRIHARQPSAGWRTQSRATRSLPRKDRRRRSIHARQPSAGWRTQSRATRSHLRNDHRSHFAVLFPLMPALTSVSLNPSALIFSCRNAG